MNNRNSWRTVFAKPAWSIGWSPFQKADTESVISRRPSRIESTAKLPSSYESTFDANYFFGGKRLSALTTAFVTFWSRFFHSLMSSLQ